MRPHIFCCYRGKDGVTDDQRKRLAAYRQVMSPTSDCRVDIFPCQIVKGLYLGAFGAAKNKTTLKSENVTHILTVGSYLPPAYPEEFTYNIIEVVDKVDEDISRYFVECIISSSKLEERVNLYWYIAMLEDQEGYCSCPDIHNATIVIAYLMKKFSMSLVKALDCVREKRPIVSPNPGFMIVLQNYERSLQGKERTRKKKERQGNGLLGFINMKKCRQILTLHKS